MNNVIFKPIAANLFRYRLIVSLITIPVAMGLLILFIKFLVDFSWKDGLLFWLELTLAGIIGSLLGQWIILKKSLETLSIIISDGYIAGQGSWVWERKKFELAKLDKANSIQRNFYHRIFGLRNLYFFDGEILQIVDSIYGKDQTEKILKTLHLEDAPGK